METTVPSPWSLLRVGRVMTWFSERTKAASAMTRESADKYSGTPMSGWIARVPNELEVDAVGLWQIIPTGRDSFNLSGEALVDFARRSIIALIERGAVPVLPAESKHEFWKKQEQYGNLATEIADGIIKEWEESGKDPDQDGLWFSLHPD